MRDWEIYFKKRERNAEVLKYHDQINEKLRSDIENGAIMEKWDILLE